jgi:hypothetical protein
MASGYDLTLDGVSFRVVRGGEDVPDGYEESFQRVQTGGQELINVPGSSLDSRQDKKHFYQTSWSGGATWEKPLLVADNSTTYFTSRGFTPTYRGGDLTPLNQVYSHDWSALLFDYTKMITVDGVTYIVGSTTITASPHTDVYSWDPATNTITRETGFDSGGAGLNIADLCYDPEQGTGTVYVQRSTEGNAAARVCPLYV